jgi:hypothetical protein
MPDKKPVRWRALVGLSLADGTRIEAGQLVPVKYVTSLPKDWFGRKVEEA